MFCVYKIVNISDYSESEYEYCRALMSEQRRNRVDRLRFADDRRRTVAGELTARKIISEHCGVSCESLRFSRTCKGKPYVEELPIYFSVSHSGEYVLCAVSSNPVGADIEKVRPVSDRLINRVCHDQEKQYIYENRVSDNEKIRRFFCIWTSKEAYCKKTGTGLISPESINTLENEIHDKMTCFIYENYAVSMISDVIPSVCT